MASKSLLEAFKSRLSDPLDLLTPICGQVANVIKLFTAVSYAFSWQARAFVPDKSIQPSQMFVGKAWSLP